MRVCFILAGVELIHKFHWLIYIFGGFLIFTGIRIITQGDLKLNPEKNPVVKFVRKIFRVTPDFEGDKFFIKRDNILWATPLFVVVVLIEATDLIFAVDSIPAILAVSGILLLYTPPTFLQFLACVHCILPLAGMEKYFTHLKYGLSAILIFVGAKMCIADFYKGAYRNFIGFHHPHVSNSGIDVHGDAKARPVNRVSPFD
jgi:tellurite resistance protein TerC